MPTAKHLSAAPVFVKKNQGFVALVAVLVIGAVGLSIPTTLLLLGLGFSKTALATVQSGQARSLAIACAEDALEKLRESVYYAGNETKIFSSGSCQIQLISGNGNTNRVLTVMGTVGTVVRKITVQISVINPTISVTSWQEF